MFGFHFLVQDAEFFAFFKNCIIFVFEDTILEQNYSQRMMRIVHQRRRCLNQTETVASPSDPSSPLHRHLSSRSESGSVSSCHVKTRHLTKQFSSLEANTKTLPQRLFSLSCGLLFYVAIKDSMEQASAYTQWLLELKHHYVDSTGYLLHNRPRLVYIWTEMADKQLILACASGLLLGFFCAALPHAFSLTASPPSTNQPTHPEWSTRGRGNWDQNQKKLDITETFRRFSQGHVERT